jgi:hypothetical protein
MERIARLIQHISAAIKREKKEYPPGWIEEAMLWQGKTT